MAAVQQQIYAAARKIGRKYVSENSGGTSKGYLSVLADIVPESEIMGEIYLGEREIPLKKIIGTRTAGRSNAFAGNFMPLLSEDTEFATKWQKLYQSHINEGIRDPIKVYEYINRYYVQEGNKRVSVLKYVGAVDISANVTRLIPRRDETNLQVSIYYEFLDFDRRAVFDNLWFTRRGSFTELVETARKTIDFFRLDMDAAELINAAFRQFRVLYKKQQLSGLGSFTTGDAFLEYCRVFGFPHEVADEQLSENIKSLYSQLLLLSRSQEAVAIETLRKDVTSPIVRLLRKAPERVRVAFAFDDTPKINPWSLQHQRALDRIVRKYGSRLVVNTLYNVPNGTRGYDKLREQMESFRPDILFTTSPNMEAPSLRLALEHPETVVLNCNHVLDNKNLNTYFFKSYESAFLLGVICGAMSANSKAGFMSASPFSERYTYDVNAFARGAQLVNPRCKILEYRLDGRSDYPEFYTACRAFAEQGADAAFCLYSSNDPLNRKAFPGIYAQVSLLNERSALPDECMGAAMCDWSVFYDQIIGDYLSERGLMLNRGDEGLSVHFGWGLNTGMTEIFGVDAFMGHNATSLLSIFREVLERGMTHPFSGPIYDDKELLRIDQDSIPSLREIQSMTWYVSGVKPLN